MNELHVVLGAGQVGQLLTERLVAAGHRVRQVRRRAGPPRAGIESRHGDLNDPSFAAEVMQGAAVAYQCVNAPYHRWAQELVPLVRSTVEGAARSGARLVVLENLYVFGRPTGPMRDNTPFAPCSEKGALRAKLCAEMLQRHARGDVKLVLGHSSDFFGPGVTESYLGERTLRRLLAGKPVEVVGDAELPHSYAFTPDIAESLRLLGTRDDVMGRSWILPASSSDSTSALLARLSAALGVTDRRTPLPHWFVRVLGLAMPKLRAFAEMMYQWELPYTVDASTFQATFHQTLTPHEVAIAQTARWARDTLH